MNSVAPASVPRLSTWVAGFTYGAFALSTPSRAGTRRVDVFDVLDGDGGAEYSSGSDGDRTCTVIFDGFLFDRERLIEEFALPRDSSYARVAASAYRAWGADCFSRLAGCYLIAIADHHQRRLLIGHDPLGRHPVFYSTRGQAIWFGANVLAVASSGQVSTRPNRLSLALAAMTLWPAAGETFFEDIRRLRAGHLLEVADDGSTRERRYWEPLPTSNDAWLSEREVHASFEPALIRAVDRCMALVPDGIMLSGGVDSVTVAALATRYSQQHGRSPLVAFSGRPNVPMLQEEHMQSRAAQALGLPHIVTHTSEWTQRRNDIDVSLEVTPDLPGPSRIYWVGTYIGFYRTAAAHHLHVLLTGSGGDNWLAVADVHAADLIRRLRLSQLMRFIEAAAKTGGSSYRAATRQLVWFGGIRPLVDSLGAMLMPATKAKFHRARAEAAVPEWLCPDTTVRRDLIDHLVERRTPALTPEGRLPRNYYQHTLATVENPHLYHEFETAFHVDAMCRLRLLSPYHDAELVRFFTHIPPAVLVHGHKYKGLLRPVVEKYLPGLGFGSQRKDYPEGANELDLKNLREGVMRAWNGFTFDRLESLGLVHPSAGAREALRAPTHSFESLVRMFALMSAEIWTRTHTT